MTMSVQQQYPQMPPTPDFLSKEEVALLKRSMLSKYPDDEQETFIRICQRTRLDPFTKQLYATRRYQKVRDENGEYKKVPTLVPVTGIMGLTAVAERTHAYDGCEIAWSAKDGEWKAEWLRDEAPEAARCVVYHKHRSHPEVGIARWNSYVGQQWNQDKKQWEITDFWDRMGDYMLAKCAKAQALRGAFPDQLSNIYIREELDSNVTDIDTETETIPTDEQKIIENRRREAELIKQFPHVVSSPPTDLTPAEMAEPADVHKLPEQPASPPKKTKAVQPPPEPAPAAATSAPPAPPPPMPSTPVTEPEEPKPDEDNIDLSSPSTDIKDAPPPWKEHVILGVAHVKFHKRKVGDLNAAELQIIENQWLPAIREQWDDATDAQREDARAFESAIAYSKMAKPF
jgi:phage recombination protein Bet